MPNDMYMKICGHYKAPVAAYNYFLSSVRRQIYLLVHLFIGRLDRESNMMPKQSGQMLVCLFFKLYFYLMIWKIYLSTRAT